MTIRIGTSGWSYDHWEHVLYPQSLPPSARLDRYTAVFSTVELNASFYRWPSAAGFRSWQRRVPHDFAMSVKAPRGLTHGKKLYAPEAWIRRIGAGWHELGDKRAVLLVQLPPTLSRDDARLDYFLGAVPDWIDVAVELRHASWHADDVFDILARHGAAYCVMSGRRRRNPQTLNLNSLTHSSSPPPAGPRRSGDGCAGGPPAGRRGCGRWQWR